MEEFKYPWQELKRSDYKTITAYQRDYQYLLRRDKVGYRRKRYNKDVPTFNNWLLLQVNRDDSVGLLAKFYETDKKELGIKYLKSVGGSTEALRLAKAEYKLLKEQ